MNIALINGSPKKTASASKILLNDLKGILACEHTIKEFSFNTPNITDVEMKELCEHDVWVFAFPLYVDGIPSHLLSCLCQIEQFGIESKEICVYSVVNCGFFEGRQNCNALAILENWCNKAGLVWGFGIGFGGGGGLPFVKDVPVGKGPKGTLGIAYRKLSSAISSKTSKENVYISIGLPKFLYKLGAEMGFRHIIKANGGKSKDLDRRL